MVPFQVWLLLLALLAQTSVSVGSSDGASTGAPPTVDVDARRVTGSSVRFVWDPIEAETIHISRDGRLLDAFDAAGATTYRDFLLWPKTHYRYRIEAFDASDTVVAAWDGDVRTRGARRFRRPYAPTSFWNEPIGADPALESRSDEMVDAAFVAHADRANLTNSDDWGYPIAFANPVTTAYDIACTRYGCDQDVRFRIPTYASENAGADGHLTIIDITDWRELDMYRAESSDDGWSAGSRYTTRFRGRGAMCPAGDRCDGAVASGFAAFGGVIRPEEIARGAIRHALAIATPHTRGDLIACPATHSSGSNDGDPTALPMGTHVQLDPALDVEDQGWPRWMETIARALQRYGAYVADTSGSLEVRAEASRLTRGYDAWKLVGLSSDSPSLADLPWDRMRVLKIRPC